MSTAEEATPQTWYRVSRSYNAGTYEARQVVKVTEKTLTYLSPRFRWQDNTPLPSEERRENLQSSDATWVRTEAEAVELSRALLTERRDRMLAQLQRAQEALADFNAAHPVSAVGSDAPQT